MELLEETVLKLKEHLYDYQGSWYEKWKRRLHELLFLERMFDMKRRVRDNYYVDNFLEDVSFELIKNTRTNITKEQNLFNRGDYKTCPFNLIEDQTYFL